VISYGVIGHEMELGRSALEKYVLTEENIFSSTDILSRLNVRKALSMMELDGSDVFG